MDDTKNSVMTEATNKSGSSDTKPARKSRARSTPLWVWATIVFAVVIATTAWVVARADSIRSELMAASKLVARLQTEVDRQDRDAALQTVDELKVHTAAAKASVNDPIWKLASSTPMVGPNITAITEVARSADDVVNLGVAPLINVYSSFNWDALLPTSEGSNMFPLEEASPVLSSAAHTMRSSVHRLEQINTTDLFPQIATPIKEAQDKLRPASDVLNKAAHAAEIAPRMLGASSPRTYLLMIQNNAETRATGGIPGALAILSVDNGKMSLQTQSNAGELGVFSPAVSVDNEQEDIFTPRMGRFMQDVNLTPDFPTSASTAQIMWQKRHDTTVDGVISIDPVALSYLLETTGPVSLDGSGFPPGLESLPSELDANNVVRTLLSDVYASISKPALQDRYFASVAQQIFSAFTQRNNNAPGLLKGLSRGVEEGRILLWSAHPAEQHIISQYPISGSIEGPSIAPAQFGVYFNDGTGAKMDYYVKRTVQLIKGCRRDGYEQTTLRVTSTNKAPSDAATSLPAYVTGGGLFGVPPGSVETNVVAYGPVQAHVETAKLDGQHTGFAPYLHSNRPVGVVAIRLAPGESRTIEFIFGKIVQHAEPNVVVTPGVQDVKDVILPTEESQCD